MSSPRPRIATRATSTPSALVPLIAPAIIRASVMSRVCEVTHGAYRPGAYRTSCGVPICQNDKGAGIIVDEETTGARAPRDVARRGASVTVVVGGAWDMAEKKKSQPPKDSSGKSGTATAKPKRASKTSPK